MRNSPSLCFYGRSNLEFTPLLKHTATPKVKPHLRVKHVEQLLALGRVDHLDLLARHLGQQGLWEGARGESTQASCVIRIEAPED